MTSSAMPRDTGFHQTSSPATWLLDGPHDLLDVERGARRARAAAMVTLALPGSAYVYQGDELGLPEAWNLPIDVLQDPIWHDSDHTVKGRDGCRVPVPWEPTGPSLGFGDGGSWLPQPPEFAALSAALQDGDADSMLTLYRTALELRRELLVFEAGFELVDLGDDVLAFRRGRFLCVANMGDESVALPDGTLVLASASLLDGQIPPDTTVWMS